MTETLASNTEATLAELAAKAAGLHTRSIEAWLECAGLLLQAREVAKHADWLPFLSKAGIAERTAQRMLKVARCGLKSAIVSDLGGPSPTIAYLNALEASMADWRDMKQTIMNMGDPALMSYWIQSVPDGPNSAILWLRDRNHVDAVLVAMDRLKIPLHESTAEWLSTAWHTREI